MSEKFSGERGSIPENLEAEENNEKYEALQKAEAEENLIMRDIENVFSTTADRAEAEKIVLEKWVPLMEEARKKSGEALKAWLDSIQKDNEQDKKESN